MGDNGAEILVGPSGDYIYGSSRGTGVVIVYKLEEDDSLVKIQEYNLVGTWPRSMAIRDNLMVVVDQHGDSGQWLQIDPGTGMVGSSEDWVFETPPGPSFIDFLD